MLYTERGCLPREAEAVSNRNTTYSIFQNNARFFFALPVKADPGCGDGEGSNKRPMAPGRLARDFCACLEPWRVIAWRAAPWRSLRKRAAFVGRRRAVPYDPGSPRPTIRLAFHGARDDDSSSELKAPLVGLVEPGMSFLREREPVRNRNAFFGSVPGAAASRRMPAFAGMTPYASPTQCCTFSDCLAPIRRERRCVVQRRETGRLCCL